MKPKCVPRRKFLQTSVGFALAGALPMQTLLAGSNPPSAAPAPIADSSRDKLHQIAQKYGGEFGPVKSQIKEA